MIALAGTYRIPQGRRLEAEPAIQAIMRATQAEPGCRAYAHAFDALDDHLVRVFELFDDADALAAHRASAHMAVWRAAAASFGLHDRALAEYEIAASRQI